MKLNNHIISLCVLGTLFIACNKDFLDVKNVEADVSVKRLYSNYTYMSGVVWNTYSYLPDGFATIYMEAATDNAEATNESYVSQLFNTGNWDQFLNFDNVLSANYKGIRQASQFLENHKNVSIDYIKNGIIGTDSTTYFNARNNLKFMTGEVFFLKAFFYFELVKRYGGVPILKVPLDYQKAESWKSVKRNTLNECLTYIVSLCDTAATIIPSDMGPFTWYDKGRVTYGAILALKARTILYAASPLYKENGSTYTWDDAAKAAQDVIATGKYKLDDNYDKNFGSDNTQTGEYIFERRYGPINIIERDNFPILFDGASGSSITPTQNLVDAYEVLVKDGSGNVTGSEMFSWSNPAHAANPYENRDSRFYATVVYNNSQLKDKSIETFTGGNSGLPKQNATKTGYYLKKWVNPGVDLLNNTTTNHTWLYFRYAEVLLNYAEAMFNVYGADNDPQSYGKTALQALNELRARAGLPALDGASLTLAKIENERNVELSFEDHRFWDVRRWKKGEGYFAVPVKKVVITKTGTNFSSEVKDLENRAFTTKMYWYPIPQSEINKTGWSQNPLW